MKRCVPPMRRRCARPTRVLVLMGGPDYWSNGIHLGLIEAADSPADESWRNINAIDDLAHDIITTTDRLVISRRCAAARAPAASSLRSRPTRYGHARASCSTRTTRTWAISTARNTGPTCCRAASARRTRGRVTQARLPMGSVRSTPARAYRPHPAAIAVRGPDRDLADCAARSERIRVLTRGSPKSGCAAMRTRRRCRLDTYRAEELARMRLNFYGFDPSCHVARYNFIHKIPKSRTPLTLARHRSRRGGQSARLGQQS